MHVRLQVSFISWVGLVFAAAQVAHSKCAAYTAVRLSYVGLEADVSSGSFVFLKRVNGVILVSLHFRLEYV